MRLRPRTVRRGLAVAAALAVSMLVAACGSAASNPAASGTAAAGASGTLNREWVEGQSS